MRANASACIAVALTLSACGADGILPVIPPRPAALEELRGLWQSRPHELDPGFVDAMDQACRSMLPGNPPPGGMRPPLVDARGGSVVVVYVDESSIFSCEGALRSNGHIGAPSSAGGGDMDLRPAAPAATAVELVSYSGIGRPGERVGGRGWVVGRAGSEVAEVRVQIGGLPEAVAARRGEWFLASLPEGGTTPVMIVGVDRGGNEVGRWTDEGG